MEKLHSIHYLKKKESINNIYPFIVYQIYGFRWCKSNHLNLQFQMRKISPLVANAYPLSRGNSISKLKSRKIMPLFLQERTKRVSSPANLHT